MADLDGQEAKTDLARVRLLFLGDSIIERWDHDVFVRQYGPANPLNLGVSGDTTQGLLWRLLRTGLGRSLRPKLIILEIGTNNTYPGGDAAHVAIGIGEDVRAIRQLSPSTRILLLGLLPRLAPVGSNTAGARAWRREGDDVNRLISACADDKTVFYANPGRALLKATQPPQDIEADYLHPTPLGYRILSDTLAGDVHRLLE